MATQLTVQQMNEAKKEVRVYVVNASDMDFPRATDEEIMSHCESKGSVYTLDYFEEQCNNKELNLSNSFIRII